MIAMALIDQFRNEARTAHVVTFTFFLCDRDDYRRNSATAIVRGLLYHLLETHTHARRILRSEYEKQKESLTTSPNSLYALWRVFRQVVTSLVSHYENVPSTMYANLAASLTGL